MREELAIFQDTTNDIYYRVGAAIIEFAIKDLRKEIEKVRFAKSDSLFEVKRIIEFYKSRYCMDLTRLSTRIFLNSAKEELDKLERYYKYYPPSEKLAKKVLPQIEEIKKLF